MLGFFGRVCHPHTFINDATCLLILYDYVKTFLTTNPLVSSLCYQTSASANRVVLDGFLTYQSSTSACNCTLTSSKSTTVRFTPLNNLHPISAICGSNILIHTGRTSFVISCFITGSATISPTQTVTLNFQKPHYVYNSGYCMLIISGKKTKPQLNKVK